MIELRLESGDDGTVATLLLISYFGRKKDGGGGWFWRPEVTLPVVMILLLRVLKHICG